MLELEKTPNRNQLLSFLLSLGLFITACMILITWNLGFIYIIQAISTGLILTLGIALLEWWKNNSTLFIYNFWNRVAGYYLKLINYLLLAVCLRFIFTAVGLAGSDRNFVSFEDNESMWKSRKTVERDYIDLQYNRFYKRSKRPDNWIINYINWSLSSENKWQIILLPFLMLLSIHISEAGDQSVTSNYTLF